MIKKEFYKHNDYLDEDMYKTYSDLDLKIRQVETGNIYDEAIDLESQVFTYEETEEPIEYEEEENEL